ncbi:MAG: hypothetical protein HPY66_2671 [Firmicutes bacterium]|nr:hypothetical protein [Bacillota bacterium]
MRPFLAERDERTKETGINRVNLKQKPAHNCKLSLVFS